MTINAVVMALLKLDGRLLVTEIFKSLVIYDLLGKVWWAH